MPDARDVEDARLLAARDYARLFAAYLPAVETRVRAQVWGAGADDVVQEVFLRIWRELQAGKVYPVPFRVVVHKVTGWLIKQYFLSRDVREVSLPDDYDVRGDDDVHYDDDSGFLELIEGLPEKQREVVVMRYGDGLEITEIAERLGMERNAVDQILWRAHERLRPDDDA